MAGKLGGNRKDFWSLMKKSNVGLITYDESEVDQVEGIGEAEAKEVPLSDIEANGSFSKAEISRFFTIAGN